MCVELPREEDKNGNVVTKEIINFLHIFLLFFSSFHCDSFMIPVQ
jgi:hypothetical protein